jgi:hypothetical protein
LAFLAALFSIRVFMGFFFSSFFLSSPLLMVSTPYDREQNYSRSPIDYCRRDFYPPLSLTTEFKYFLPLPRAGLIEPRLLFGSLC